MKVSLFDFELPDALIAQHPVDPRDSARLLHVTPSTLADCAIKDLPSLLRPGDVLVFNDTKVIPARLFGARGAARVEVTLHKPLDALNWEAFARPAKRLRVGDTITFAPSFTATVTAKQEGEVTLHFEGSAEAFMTQLTAHGHMPLPPYIRQGKDVASDSASYQTVYAKHPGAVAAPTAGLHFTPALLEGLESRGIHKAFVTLHVGAGTFLPVKVENTEDHVMHSELATLSAETAASINKIRIAGGRIVVVGTTALRVLESAADDSGMLHSYHGETDIFITPGYRFKSVDVLLTNFHLPRSTLFMLVCAFVGTDRMKQAYAHAIAANYRFYSYGDACLLER